MKVKTRWWLTIAGGLWLILFVYSYPKLREASKEKSNLERTFDHYADAVVHGNYDEAYAQWGSDLQHAMDYQRFVAGYKSLDQQYGPLKSYKRESYHAVGNGTPIKWTADVVARFFYEKKTVTFDFGLYKERDRWMFFRVEQE
jgi:hypothetical protein